MSKEIKLGLFGIITVLGVVFGLKFLAGNNLLGKSKYYYIYVDNAKGIIPSSPVMAVGFKVGTVTDVAFTVDDNKKAKVRIELRVDEPLEVRTDAIAEILETGFVGGKAVRIQINPQSSAPIAKNKATLQARSLNILQAMIGSPEELHPYTEVLKNSLIGAYDTISVQAKDPTAPGVGKMFNDMDIILADMKITSRNLNRMIAASNQQVGLILNDLAAITGNLKQSNEAISKIIAHTQSITAKLDSAGLDKTIAHTDEAIMALKSTLDVTKKSLASIDQLVSKAGNGDGSFAKLINDKELYDNLNKSSKNLDLLLQDLRLNPNRYVKVSVFGKKTKKYTLPENDPANKN